MLQYLCFTKEKNQREEKPNFISHSTARDHKSQKKKHKTNKKRSKGLATVYSVQVTNKPCNISNMSNSSKKCKEDRKSEERKKGKKKERKKERKEDGSTHLLSNYNRQERSNFSLKKTFANGVSEQAQYLGKAERSMGEVDNECDGVGM
jgi:hypothetical protein